MRQLAPKRHLCWRKNWHICFIMGLALVHFNNFYVHLWAKISIINNALIIREKRERETCWFNELIGINQRNQTDHHILWCRIKEGDHRTAVVFKSYDLAIIPAAIPVPKPTLRSNSKFWCLQVFSFNHCRVHRLNLNIFRQRCRFFTGKYCIYLFQ